MFPRMTTATAKTSHGWSVEIAFPLYGDAASGGLLDVGEVDGVAAGHVLCERIGVVIEIVIACFCMSLSFLTCVVSLLVRVCSLLSLMSPMGCMWSFSYSLATVSVDSHRKKAQRQQAAKKQRV